MAVITLLTDFGLADTYLGQMKGAILAVAPQSVIVDLTHAVAPQDVRAGAFLLWSAVEAFPAGAIHVAVVDPGVGSSRRAVAIESARRDVFVGPDNGLLMPAAHRLGGCLHAVELTNSAYWRQPSPSATFHGRDIFGPVAAHLANAVPLSTLGQSINDPLDTPMWPSAEGLRGEVIHVDAYGNLITNLPAGALPTHFAVIVNGHHVASARSYAAVAPGELLALVGSAGLLEVSARDASAAQIASATRGTPVSVIEKR